MTGFDLKKSLKNKGQIFTNCTKIGLIIFLKKISTWQCHEQKSIKQLRYTNFHWLERNSFRFPAKFENIWKWKYLQGCTKIKTKREEIEYIALWNHNHLKAIINRKCLSNWNESVRLRRWSPQIQHSVNGRWYTSVLW